MNLSNPLIYSSAAIKERRQRILRETRRIIADRGIEALTMRGLSERAGVALPTLYRAFQSKEKIIGAAIVDSFNEINKSTYYYRPIDTLDGNIERLVKINQKNLAHKGYARAITSIYFSPSVSQDLLLTLQSMALINLTPWLNRLQKEGELGSWVDRKTFEMICINNRYANIHDWSNGRIDDEAYFSQLVLGTLILAAGATTGRTRARAMEILNSSRERDRYLDSML